MTSERFTPTPRGAAAAVGDEPQDFGEEILRNGDFGHLDSDHG